MGLIKDPIPVKLFTGMLSPEPALFDACASILSKEFGPIDHESEAMPWNNTDYYREEMGDGLIRKFIFFKELMDPARLASVKLLTNSIEEKLSVRDAAGMRRRINIDPGYVTEAKVVLASSKDFAHRLYIGGNIYAEVTLRYSNKERSFMACDHTFFDFRTVAYKTLFNVTRDMLRAELKRTE